MASVPRMEALARGVLAPLVLGGKLELVQPFGAKLALAVDPGFRILDDDTRSRVGVARVRIARLVAPLDSLPDPTAHDWALVAALNDLLQATNHHLSGPFTRGRHERLVELVDEVLTAVGPPRSMLAAISRHTLFARLFELVRKDTLVKWWTGSANFRGEPPAGRLLKWKNFRRVHTDTSSIPVVDLVDGVRLAKDRWLSSLALFLTRSPLTDLATAGRVMPTFAWSPATLAFVYQPMGSKLAARAVAASRNARANGALEAAINRLPAGKARAIALRFSEEAAAKLRGLKGLPKEEPKGASEEAAVAEPPEEEPTVTDEELGLPTSPS
ncbi:MAG: hypothetical protein U0414_15820 [Polyangiaceae bacterium]